MMRSIVEGLELTCRFSEGCPLLLTGQGQETVIEFLRNPISEKAADTEMVLRRMDSFLFYNIIALMTGTGNVFHKNVVRAHWLGNEFLGKITKTVFQKAIEKISLCLDEEKVRILKAKYFQATGGTPHHNSFVFSAMIGDGDSGQWKNTISPAIIHYWNNCLAKPAEVLEVKDGKMRVATLIFSQKGENGNKKFVLEPGEEIVETGFVDSRKVFFCKTLKNYVAIHLRKARKKITDSEAKLLDELTRESFNFALERV